MSAEIEGVRGIGSDYVNAHPLMTLALTIGAPLIIYFGLLAPDVARRDRVFLASWGSSLVSSFGFGAVLLDEWAVDIGTQAAVATEDAIDAAVGIVAANPLVVPSAFGALSLAGFAWSALLYRRAETNGGGGQ